MSVSFPDNDVSDQFGASSASGDNDIQHSEHGSHKNRSNPSSTSSMSRNTKLSGQLSMSRNAISRTSRNFIDPSDENLNHDVFKYERSVFCCFGDFIFIFI
jgi:hypothetical protein